MEGKCTFGCTSFPRCISFLLLLFLLLLLEVYFLQFELVAEVPLEPPRMSLTEEEQAAKPAALVWALLLFGDLAPEE